MAGLEALKIKDDVQTGDSPRVVKRERESLIVTLPDTQLTSEGS